MIRLLPILVVASCGSTPTRPSTTTTAGAGQAQLSLAADEAMIVVPGGRSVAGSTKEERTAAYDDYEQSSGKDVARKYAWFEREADRHVVELPAFAIDLMPVTQAAYGEFVATGQAKPPVIDEAAWRAQGFQQDFATEVSRFVWVDNRPPRGREDHPVVLVTWAEAKAYCAWRGTQRGIERRLPTADEFEKASRGTDGLAYPWGNTFEAKKLASAASETRDTMPAGSYAAGASPFGVMDLAGNVFQWTASMTPDKSEVIVKGSAWDDWAGVGRGASWHGRAPAIRHAIIGFRCAGPAPAQ